MRENVTAQVSGRPEDWTIDASVGSPWSVVITAPSGERFEGAGIDLFQALKAARLPLDERGILLCCNGARINAHPSGLTSSQGGDMVYLNHRWRPAGRRDLRYVFGPAPARKIATVAEQDRFWEEFADTTGISWTMYLNPVRWFYLAAQSLRGRK
ncbi:hypothetical protein [Kitasatospora sp. NPDC058218]|uniref:hypothetical protein n=1 Tax=Kitasatospora sp. NPDC058218 TaxID=3346385 RepID=UPI0036D963F9